MLTRVLLALVAMLTLSAEEHSYALDHAEAYVLYQNQREDIESQYEAAIRMLAEKKQPSATEEDMKNATNGLKLLFYNKAYLLVACARSAPRSTDVKLIITYAKDCIYQRGDAFSRVYGRIIT